VATVGSFEAKTHLAALLDRVAQGEEIVITRHGKPVARLVPAMAKDRDRVRQAIGRMKELRRGSSLGGPWKELRDEGRR
jgi:prevent-host-death family protein